MYTQVIGKLRLALSPPEPQWAHIASYDPGAVGRFWRALVQVDSVLRRHRGSFLGRSSQVNFFWGTFDLAYTRYSGRPAEPPPGSGIIYRRSADAEQICAGFWPGDERLARPAFFSY